MWTAIRSDLKEFASSIATDSNTVLENIDSKLKEDDGNDDNGNNDGGVDEYGLTTGISANEYGNDNNNNNDDNNDNETKAFLTNDQNDNKNNNNNNHDGNKATKKQEEDEIRNSMRSDAQEEAYRRMGMEITFMTPLLQDEVNGVKLNSSLMDADTATDTNETDTTDTDTNDTEDVKKDEDVNVNETEVQAESNDNTNTTNDNDKNIDINIRENTDEEEKEIKEYITSFDLSSKTTQITNLLSTQPHLSQHFENLVPLHITYEQFWLRYFYRCDVDRIINEWLLEVQMEELDHELNVLKRKELIGKGVKSVQSMFGGALKVIKNVGVNGSGSASASANASSDTSDTGAGASIYEKYQAEIEQKQKAMTESESSGAGAVTGTGTGTNTTANKTASIVGTAAGGFIGGALNMFGNGSRPPFVMNTVDSSDNEDDDYEDENEEDDIEDEEEEEEEELGWGSDEDDDDDDDDDEDEEEYEEYEEEETFDENQDDTLNESGQETIIFENHNNNNNNNNMNSDSDKVIEEIEKLKSMLEEAQHQKYNTEQNAKTLQNDYDAYKLRMEKECHDLKSSMEEEIGKLKIERECERERDQATALALSKASSSSGGTSDASQVLIQNLTSQLNDAESNKRNAEMMVQNLKDELALCKEEMKNQNLTSLNHLKSLQDEMANVKHEQQVSEEESKMTIQNLKTQLVQLDTHAKEANANALKVQQDLDFCKEEMKKQSLNFAKTLEDEIAKVRAEHQREHQHENQHVQGVSVTMSPSAQEGSSLSSAVEISPLNNGSNEEVDVNDVHTTPKDEEMEEDAWGDSWSDDDDE